MPGCERCIKPGTHIITESEPNDNAYHTALCFEHVREFLKIRSEVFSLLTCSLNITRIPDFSEDSSKSVYLNPKLSRS